VAGDGVPLLTPKERESWVPYELVIAIVKSTSALCVDGEAGPRVTKTELGVPKATTGVLHGVAAIRAASRVTTKAN
jgi:hypothetical protein